jgi:hypothetical protein
MMSPQEIARRVARGASDLAVSSDSTTIEPIRDLMIGRDRPKQFPACGVSAAGHESHEKREIQYARDESGTIYWL